MRLTVFRGYSGSGKTTRAHQLPGVKVSRDELRRMVFGTVNKTKLSKEQEQQITTVQHGLVRESLRKGLDVVVHDTNLSNQHYAAWLRLAQKEHVDFEGVWLTEDDPDVLLKRNFARPDDVRVPDSVIRNQLARFPVSKWKGLKHWAAPKFERKAPKWYHYAFIVDLDGTLAHATNRDIYDGSLCHTDELDEQVAGIVRSYRATGRQVIYCSGRSDEFREQTQNWLDTPKFKLPKGPLHMRKAGDTRPDWVVKGEIFESLIDPRFYVEFALDDRDQVVKLWRSLGIKTLQVGDGDF